VKLSIIIVNYNVRHFLAHCLLSAKKAVSNIDAEIIVLDNASEDGSKEMMSEEFADIRYIYLDENVGFSKANNIGIKESKGEYVLLLNPDTVVAEDAFEQCIEFMDGHQDCGGLGVRMLDGNGVFLPESKRGLPTPAVAFYKIFGLAQVFPKSRVFGQYHLGYLDETNIHEVDVLSGAFMFMRKTSLEKAGLLDETFFMYGEDIDLSFRLTQAGYKNYYLPAAKIIHYKGESTKTRSVNYVFVFYNAMVIFAKKHYERGRASLFGLLIKLAIYLRAGVAIANRLFGKLWQQGVDFILYSGVYYATTHTYASYADKDFSLSFIEWMSPIFTLVLLATLTYSSTYDRPFRFSRYLVGWAIGFGVLLATYSLLPETYRFSRAVVIIGSGASLVLGLVWRLGLSLLSPSALKIGQNDPWRTVFITSRKSLDAIHPYRNSKLEYVELVAGLTAEKTSVLPTGFVGQSDQLKQAIVDFGFNEVVFDCQTLSYAQVIDQMELCNQLNVQVKMLNPDQGFMIGSNTVVMNNDVLSVDHFRNVNKERIRREKRTFDLLLSGLLLITYPLAMLFVENKTSLFKNLIGVFTGTLSFVGYDQRGTHRNLPTLKPGIISSLQHKVFSSSEKDITLDENIRYVKSYQLAKDLQLVLRHFQGLGRKMV